MEQRPKPIRQAIPGRAADAAGNFESVFGSVAFPNGRTTICRKIAAAWRAAETPRLDPALAGTKVPRKVEELRLLARPAIRRTEIFIRPAGVHDEPRYRGPRVRMITPLLFETGIFRRLARSHQRGKCSKRNIVAAFTNGGRLAASR